MQDDIDRVIAASQPIIDEVDRLEREYGFDRPPHQGQCLMLPLDAIIAFRASINAIRARLQETQP